MPTPATPKWPKPKSEDEFEDMVVDFLRLRWRDPLAVRNGRRGQRQHGVDIIGHPPWLNGKTAGAQCKNTESVALAAVITEVEKAKSFQGGLGEFLFVTASDRDSALQAQVREHFKAHPAPFEVTVIFWPDVVADLSTDDALVAKHWKGFQQSSPSGTDVEPPKWIERSDVPKEQTAECQGEISLSIPNPGLELATSELTSELGKMAKEGIVGPRLGALLKQVPRHGDTFTYAQRSRPFGNVTEKLELEIGGGGHLSYRWARFWDQPPLFNTEPLIEHVVRAVSAYRLALERTTRGAGISVPTRMAARLAAQGSGVMLLQDEIKFTLPKFLMSSAESPAHWSVEIQADWGAPLLGLATRLLNLGLSNFRLKGGGDLIQLNDGVIFVQIDQEALAEFVAKVCT